MSRPRITWVKKDVEQFETLCKIQCSKTEICAVMNVNDRTLNRLVKENYHQSFEKVQDRLREFGKASLLRSQFKLAERNPSMAIWLGKQFLSQQDPFRRKPPGGGSSGLSRLEQFLDEADQL